MYQNSNHRFTVNSNEDFSREAALYHSDSGVPCLWEFGGSSGNTGIAQIIADGNGGRKPAIQINTDSQFANSRHALIPVEVGDIIITARIDHGDTHIVIERIFDIWEDSVALELAYPPLHCTNGIQAAATKASDYNCHRPYYIANPPQTSNNI